MASSGRYQSRLFNFVNQQSRRLTEQCDRAFRHLQVSASWGIQLLLYPIYLLFQPRASGKQLYQTAQQSWLQLPADETNSQSQNPPTADTPIQRALLLVDALPFPQESHRLTEEAVSTSSPGTEPINFLAFLASNALTRFAKSLGRFKLFPNSPKSRSSLTHPSSPTPYSPLTDSPNRHRSVVRGIATQLSSRTLVLITAENEVLDILTPQQQQKLHERIIGEVADYWRHQRLVHSAVSQALTFLDRTVADLESNYLARVSEVAITLGQRSWELVQRVQTQLIPSFGNTQPADIKSPTVNPTDAHTLRIQALIWAAIDYFFGSRGGKPLELQADSKPRRKLLPQRRSTSKPDSQLHSRSSLVSPDIDPWLTLSDLFGEPELESEPSTQQMPESSKSRTISQATGKTNPALPSSQSPGYSLRNLLNSFQGWQQSKQASGLVKPQKKTVSTGESSTPRSQSTQLDPAPDWIETNATVIGYVKHPLEQLLTWLDRAMLWLENALSIVWWWVQQLLRGK